MVDLIGKEYKFEANAIINENFIAQSFFKKEIIEYASILDLPCFNNRLNNVFLNSSKIY